MRKSADERLMEITVLDRSLWARQTVFAGIDEAGRGPLAGPVAAACVIMPEAPLLKGINDSKKVSPARREALYDEILAVALYARVAMATVEEIDRLNIREATRLAMSRAAQDAGCALFLVDGREAIETQAEQRAIIGGDASCYSIAAASILAKVARDRLMLALDAEYPAYGFAAHKGYGTAAHIEAIRAHGPCPVHRSLFIRNFV